MLRRTKIVTTLGPATDDLNVLTAMVRAGADVVRLNFSHGKPEEHMRRIELVRQAAQQVGRYVGVLGDLSGPKIRIERFANGPIQLKEDDFFTLDVSMDPQAGYQHAVGVAYKDLPKDVHTGDILLLNDGLISLEVEKVDGPRIHTRVRLGGELSDKKGINRQGGGLSAGALTDKDREDIKTAAKMKVDYLAVSFVQSAADINEARALLRAAGGEGRLVAKIERAEALQNLGEIIEASDVVMVARGDLGVEMGYAELTGLQKTIIHQTRNKNRVVITATQMMESMIVSPIPTRAEVSDVANAVMDGTDAVMLSAETAAGKYPVKAVEAMSEVIQGAEKYHLAHSRMRHRAEGHFRHTEEAIAMAVMYTANHMKVAAIVALTETGETPLWMSRMRSDIPIYAFTRHATTRQWVTLFRGVYPVPFDVPDGNREALYRSIFKCLLDMKLVKQGELVILTKGELTGVTGGTNSMQIIKVAAD